MALAFFATPEPQRASVDASVSRATQQIVKRLLTLDAGACYGAMVLIRVPTIYPDGIELYGKIATACVQFGLHNRLAVLMCGARSLRGTALAFF